MTRILLATIIATTAIGGAVGYFSQPLQSEPSTLALANIEALSNSEIELPEVVIECGNMITMGRCFKWDPYYLNCIPTGNPQDYCKYL